MKTGKKLVAVLLILTLILGSFAACGGSGGGDSGNDSDSKSVEYPADFQAFLDVLDTSYSTKVDKAISEMGDDPALGFRSSGSPAEKETAEYVKGQMEELGLENITIDKVEADGWTFKGANITYKDAEGTEQNIDLGGYQTTIQAKNEKIKVVYLQKGTADDYKDVDVKDKLVLIDIDQNEEWWINTPAYQAHVKGAKGVLANSAMPVEMDDRIGTQDICGPDDAPALGISQEDTDALKAAIKATGKDEIEVTFNADSKVTKNATTTNVWGEIPGKTDEVIYMMAHRDGYFHSFYDDASGVGLCLGVAKALKDSKYQPDKTIRFVFHGAEEWGKVNSQSDWAIGAYKQITEKHPEWAEKGFAIVNIDGAYCVEDETTFGISVCEELYNYIDPLVKPMTDASGFKYKYMMPPSTYKEDFNYISQGIPSVATAKGEETLFYDTAYHTSADSDDVMKLDEDTWLWMHTLYARIVFGFDDLAARPMDFTTRLEALKESYDDSVVSDSALIGKIDGAIESASPLAKKVTQLNVDYEKALADEDADTTASLREDAIALNTQLFEAYKAVQAEVLHLDQEMSIIFPHENRQSNIVNIRSAIESLEAGKAEEAYDEYLSGVGTGWNAMFFDKETVDFFGDGMKEGIAGTWAEGLVDVPDCYVDDVVRSLMDKVEKGDKDFSAEIKELQSIKKEQQDYLDEVIKKEKDGMDKLVKTFNDIK